MPRFLTIIFLSISINSFCQWYTINFENNGDTLIKVDTTNPSNIWQTGKPQKLFFGSAYSPANAIVTDTINYYPKNNTSSFALKISDPTTVGWDVWVSLKHKYNSDSLMDGGYLEITFDGGNSWNNIANVTDLSEDIYSVNDTILGGTYALSGKSNWITSNIFICGFKFLPSNSAFLKFVFKSDSIQTNKDGWMIDNVEIWYVADACAGVNELSNKNSFIKISPNPFNVKSILELTNPHDNLQEIEIYNCYGKKIAEYRNISNNQLQLNRNKFSEGLYFYKIKTKNNYSESGKFVVE